MKERKKRDGKSRKKDAKSRAERADRYALYQESVQDPEGDVSRLRRMYARHFGGAPRHLREDFCGSALLACCWVRAGRDHRATGIDLDPEPLEWGREHNLVKLRPEQLRRLRLVEADVRAVRGPAADVVAAFNFSYSVFKNRRELLHYFRRAHAGLARRGIFVLDAYGGPEAQERRAETREYDGFDYVWDQDLFDPITHHTRCLIHFEFSDGSRLERAFRYDWRLWMLPELRDLLEEAGFDAVEVYWEGTERGTDEGNGIFRPRRHAEDDPAWIAYVVAVKGA
ncbi:MAG: class I SAM-dependent methyltransferase [Myxococcota bacterium]